MQTELTDGQGSQSTNSVVTVSYVELGGEVYTARLPLFLFFLQVNDVQGGCEQRNNKTDM